jgi:hypothetical protein
LAVRLRVVLVSCPAQYSLLGVTIPFKPIVKLISSNAHGAELILPPENERYFAKVITPFVVELQTSKIDKGILISIKLLSPGI